MDIGRTVITAGGTVRSRRMDRRFNSSLVAAAPGRRTVQMKVRTVLWLGFTVSRTARLGFWRLKIGQDVNQINEIN